MTGIKLELRSISRTSERLRSCGLERRPGLAIDAIDDPSSFHIPRSRESLEGTEPEQED